MGYFNDPQFGPTTASIVTQITPTAFDPNFGQNPVIDSVILTIPYFSRTTGVDALGLPISTISDSLYGDEDASIQLFIYENNYIFKRF